MLKQTIYISNPMRLSLRNRQLVLSNKEGELVATRPIEDIGAIVIENQQTAVTLPVLTFMAANNVAVVLCDNHFMPAAMVMPLEANTTQAESYALQLNASEPVRKQLWRMLVESKIRNQARMLKVAQVEGDPLKPYYTAVRSGDPDNREGAAARAYWPLLFGSHFERDRYGEFPNPLLNYGYAILRAATARALLGSGLSPMFGVFHHNRYNAFPLADDVMEPYRPMVDNEVWDLCNLGITELTLDAKKQLMSVLLQNVDMDSQQRPIQNALTMTAASIVKYLKGDVKTISLPTLQL